MFWMSEIIQRACPGTGYEIIRERPFEILVLCDMDREEKACTFIEDKKYVSFIPDNTAMVITTPQLAQELDLERYGAVITDHPRVCFFQIHNFLGTNTAYGRQEEMGCNFISPEAEISDRAVLAGKNICIAQGVVIEPFVTIYSNVQIGKNSVIRAGACIGGEGFEFKKMEDGILPVRHLGSVLIGENVEIQNHTCVDKAVYPWDVTEIGNHVKIDNLVHIAHGVKIGDGTLVVAGAAVGGRVCIGANAWIGIGAVIRNGLRIGEHARVNMGSVVTRDVPDGHVVTGNFAIPHSRFITHRKSLDQKS